MNIVYKKTILLIIVLIILSIFCVWIFTSPAILVRFNLTETSNIGGTIGGLTSPILGIISVMFLYLTLNKQIDGIKDQQIKNESDLIFMMLNQLNTEYNQIYYYNTKKKDKPKLYGYEALTEYSETVNKFYMVNSEKKFSEYDMSQNIILVVRSFKLIEERIKLSNVNKNFKNLFSKKLETFYQCKLENSFFKLIDLFNRVPALNDEYTKEIIEFYKYNSEKVK